MGKTTGQIADELGFKSPTITKIKQEFRELGIRWEGDGVDDDYDPSEESSDDEPTWPTSRPPAAVEIDPDIIEARKQTALKQQQLADLRVERELRRVQLELEGKPSTDQSASLTTEIVKTLLQTQLQPRSNFFTPQLVTALVSGMVTAVQSLRQPPTDPLKMFSEFQKIISTAGGIGGGVEDVAEGNILGTVIQALARTPANPQATPPVQGPPQRPQVDPRQQRNMQFLGMLARECRLGSDPAVMARAMADTLGVLPEEFRRVLMTESLSTILGALPTMVPPEVVQDFHALGQEPRHRAWLEKFLAAIRDGNRLGGMMQEAEETPQAPAPSYNLFPGPDPENTVALPPNGPQVPPSR